MKHWSKLEKLDELLGEAAREATRTRTPLNTPLVVTFTELRELVDLALELKRLRRVLGIGDMTAQELEALLEPEDRAQLELAELLTQACARIAELEKQRDAYARTPLLRSGRGK